MIAIRQIIRPDNKRITIDLPADFSAEEVEIIIMPVEDKNLKLKAVRKFGSGKEFTTIRDSFYEPVEDFKEYM